MTQNHPSDPHHLLMRVRRLELVVQVILVLIIADAAIHLIWPGH